MKTVKLCIGDKMVDVTEIVKRHWFENSTKDIMIKLLYDKDISRFDDDISITKLAEIIGCSRGVARNVRDKIYDYNHMGCFWLNGQIVEGGEYDWEWEYE